MLTKEDKIKRETALIDSEVKRLKAVIKEIEAFLEDNKVSEKGLRMLVNIQSEVDTFTSSYLWRILSLAKQNIDF